MHVTIYNCSLAWLFWDIYRHHFEAHETLILVALTLWLLAAQEAQWH
jgi:hypothetical protein